MEEAPSSSSTLEFSLGIDVGKTALELVLRDGEGIVARTTVPNDSDGHENLLSWLLGREAGPEKTCVCMESSGAFEKDIALHLHEEGYRVSARVRGELKDTRRANFSARRQILPMLR
jgi:transposase